MSDSIAAFSQSSVCIVRSSFPFGAFIFVLFFCYIAVHFPLSAIKEAGYACYTLVLYENVAWPHLKLRSLKSLPSQRGGKTNESHRRDNTHFLTVFLRGLEIVVSDAV